MASAKRNEKITIQHLRRRRIRIAIITAIVFFCAAASCVLEFYIGRKFGFHDGLTFLTFLSKRTVMVSAAVLTALFISTFTEIVVRKSEKTVYSKFDAALDKIINGELKVQLTDDSASALKTNEKLHNVCEGIAGLIDANNIIAERCETVEIECRNAVFRSISARINPEIVRMGIQVVDKMAADGRSEDISKLTDNLNHIVDASIADGAQLVSLAEELGRIRPYIEIIELAEKQKIRCRMSIMCNIVNYKVIPNLVLPVIENVYRAAEKPAEGEDPLEINIEVTSSPSNMLIIIRDNCKTPSNFVTTWPEGETLFSSGEMCEGLPLSLISHRMSAYYGERFVIKSSVSALGNAVYLYLPPQGNEF